MGELSRGDEAVEFNGDGPANALGKPGLNRVGNAAAGFAH